jgi:hypothetical protein
MNDQRVAERALLGLKNAGTGIWREGIRRQPIHGLSRKCHGQSCMERRYGFRLEDGKRIGVSLRALV